MKTFRRIFAIILIVSLILVVSACSKDAGDKLVGTWKSVETSEKVTFKENGTVVWDEGEVINGKYTLEGDTLTIDLEGDKQVATVKTLEDGKLVLDFDGYIMTFTKK